MGLIALLPHKRQLDDKFLYFVNIKRWIELKELFEREACQLYHIERHPYIHNVLQVGISAMRTPHCGKKHDKS